MANFNKSDLEFILAQIKIAEDHTAAITGGADPRTSLLNLIGGSPNLSFGLRTVSGEFNNLLDGRTHWGQADQPFVELLDPSFLPGYEPGPGMVSDATPRQISNLVVDMSINNPAAVEQALSHHDLTTGQVDAITALSQGLASAKATNQVLLRAGGEAGTAAASSADAAAAVTTLAGAPTEDNRAAAIAAATTAADDAAALLASLTSNSGVPADDVADAQALSDAAAALVTDLNTVDIADAVAVQALADAADANSTAAGELQTQVEGSSAAAAAAETTAYDALRAGLVGAGVEVLGEDDTLVIPNVAPDEGLSAPFNSWMTLFGQFFDHGLDLINKGNSGIIFMPLGEDDPLFDPASPTNFMVLTRADVAGDDGVAGTPDDVPAVNATTPFVDQNQTYASTPSHQVFLREYELVGGAPVPTGNLIKGAGGGMATWADVKAQAASMLGIALTDADAVRVPQLLTDLYGNFVPGPNGLPQLIIPGTSVEGNLATPVAASSAISTGHAFLIDIAHNANPFNAQTGAALAADGDVAVNDIMAPRPAGTYDDELLDAHFMAGDGRANENIGLTAVHHVFHAEHNRLVEFSKDIILASLANENGTAAEAAADLAFLNEWLRVDLPDGTDVTAIDPASLDWDGARLFQAAKFGTEMQYQHLVFEDFARKIQPQIDVFVAPVGYDVDIDPTIFAEFAHTVYRFGHSMLTETVDRFDANFDVLGTTAAPNEQVELVTAFLNPTEFDRSGALSPEAAAGAVVRGMTRQVANEIDEFVTDALRSNLLGLPLDLASINLARARDLGIPSLNQVRADFFAQTGDSLLRPYTSWFDFSSHIKNQVSIVNFIAAYGTHESITSVETIAEKRDAAMKIVFGDTALAGAEFDAFEDERLDFLRSTGAWASQETGLNNVDLWIGGLAEQISPFGGMLGSTFNFVFETQLENLQIGDRFYYLARTAGMNFLAELEQNSFASMIVANTNATHLPIDVFATPSYVLEVNQSQQFNGELGSDDPFEQMFGGRAGENGLVIRDGNSLEYTGGDHVVLGGTEGNDVLTASIGDDAIWGDGGNDTIEGGHGNDNIDGGTGDDIITDVGGDDVIKGGDGNDVIHGGPGLNLIISGRGHDFVVTGEDSSEVFAGTGNDFIHGTTTNEAPVGGAGDDWFEVGNQDGAAGDDSDPFGADPIAGHDVFLGDGGFDEYVAEGGDDIMVGSFGINRNEGMSGFDWVTYKDLPSVYADLQLPAFDETPQPPSPDTAIDRYEAVEGMSGTPGDDTLIGTDVADLGAADPEEPLVAGGNGQLGSVLTAAGIARIAGLQELLGPGVTEFRSGNILLGGDGNDLIEGGGGDDIIDGDKWLNVRIAHDDGRTWDKMAGALQIEVLAGNINPGDLNIVREILEADGSGDVNTARFVGPRANYQLTFLEDRTIVSDLVGADGTDTLFNVQRLEFSDATISASNDVASGNLQVEEVNGQTNGPTEGERLRATLVDVIDPQGTTGATFSFNWQILEVDDLLGDVWIDIEGATGRTFVLTEEEVDARVRAVVTFRDDAGNLETVVSSPTAIVGDRFVGTGAPDDFGGTAGADFANTRGGDDVLEGDGGDDILIAGAGDDELFGGEGNDDLRGGGGNDTFESGPGADAVQGGGGRDIIIMDAADVLEDIVDGGNGIDTVITTANVIDLSGPNFSNVENVEYDGDGNFAATGNALRNSLQGNDGSDTLDGGAGIDTMIGGEGDDTYFVDHANDRVTEAGDEGIDTVFSSVTERLTANVENLTLSGTGNINGTGNDLNNVIEGNGGVNLLIGGGGNDEMLGRAGNDELRGGAGDDTLNGNNGADRLLGHAGNDILRGGNGNDFLRGGAGSDTLIGGAGNDDMNGQGGPDEFRFVNETFGDDDIFGFQLGIDVINLNPLGVDVATALGLGTLDVTRLGANRALVELQAVDPDTGADVDLGSIDVRGTGVGNAAPEDLFGVI